MLPCCHVYTCVPWSRRIMVMTLNSEDALSFTGAMKIQHVRVKVFCFSAPCGSTPTRICSKHVLVSLLPAHKTPHHRLDDGLSPRLQFFPAHVSAGRAKHMHAQPTFMPQSAHLIVTGGTGRFMGAIGDISLTRSDKFSAPNRAEG